MTDFGSFLGPALPSGPHMSEAQLSFEHANGILDGRDEIIRMTRRLFTISSAGSNHVHA